MKVMTVVGTRPELIRLSRVIAKLDDACDHILVHTGQNYDYELNQIFFEDLEIRSPDIFLNSAAGGASVMQTIANLLVAVDEVLVAEEPEALLVLGDTNSCLAALPAKRRKIPVFHMEAGNRCFDQRVPEEINRKIVDHISDINLPYSSIAREYLLAEGVPPDRIIKTGSPMAEVLTYFNAKISKSSVLYDLNLSEKQYFVVSAHREENIDLENNFRALVSVINGVALAYELPIIISVHPRTRKRIEASGVSFEKNVSLHKPLGFLDYIALQKSAKVVLSDSGTISEESSILNFDAINIREAHERPEAMEEGAVIMAGLRLETILDAINFLQGNDVRRHDVRTPVDYDVDFVSDKVVKIILSYTGYVNRNVWKRYAD